MSRTSLRWLLPLLLVLTSLACSAVYWLVELDGPEAAATDVFLAPTPPPFVTRTPIPADGATPSLAPGFLDSDLAEQALESGAVFADALRPEFAADARLLPDATRYVIDVSVRFNSDGSASLSGQVRLRYTNTSAGPLEDLVLMLWPNEGQQYLSGMRLGEVRVDGAPVEPELDIRQLSARLPLAAPLGSGERVEVRAAFDLNAYPGIDEVGAARFGLTNDVLLAPTFYPLVPRRVDGAWQTEPAPPGGDTTNSDSAFYLWRITAPADLAVAASGTLIDTFSADGQQHLTLVAGPMRDLALTVGPLQLIQREVGGVQLNAYVLEQNTEYAADLLDYAAGQLQVMQELVGPYPFAELDVVDAPGAFGGIEYPGLIYIGVVDGSDFFLSVTVHEVGHQWFYSVVGNDQLRQPWLDEALATYTEVLYREQVLGTRSAQGMLDYLQDALESADDPEVPIGRPVADYASGSDYGLLVYLKGALFFDALRSQMGDKAFFDFLQRYYAAYRYGFADASGLQREAEAACACDLDALFDVWVYKGGPISPP